MQIDDQRIKRSRRQITVSLTGDEIKPYFEAAVAELSASLKLAGFRPGKAPLEIARGHLKESQIRDRALAFAIRKLWPKIIKAKKLTETGGPLHDPEVEAEQFDENQPAKIIFIFDIVPEVTVGAWQEIKLLKEHLTKIQATQDEVDQMLKRLSRGQAKQVVSTKAIKKENLAIITFTGKIQNVVYDKLSGQKMQVEVGTGLLLPDFEKALIGMEKRGEQEA